MVIGVEGGAQSSFVLQPARSNAMYLNKLLNSIIHTEKYCFNDCIFSFVLKPQRVSATSTGCGEIYRSVLFINVTHNLLTASGF